MAKLYGEIAASALLTLDKSFARALGQPLDSTEVYYSAAAAEEYAKTPNAYVGQKLVVIENGVVTHYSVEDTAGTLKELGSKPVADGTTVAIGEDGKITLANIAETNKTGTYNAVLVNGKLTWVKPSETTVEGLSDLIQALTGRVETIEGEIDNLGGLADANIHPDSEHILYLQDYEVLKPGQEEGTGEWYTGLGVSLGLHYESTYKKIYLVGAEDEVISEIDATDFIKDGMIESVELVNEKPVEEGEDGEVEQGSWLKITWNTDVNPDEGEVGEKDVVYLDVSELVDVYAAGNGLELTDSKFSVKLASGSESFLTVTADGVKLSGVQTAINTAKQAAIDDAAGKYATKEELTAHSTTAANTYATKEYVGTIPNTSTAQDIVSYIDEKLENIEDGAQVNVIESVVVSNGTGDNIVAPKLTASLDAATKTVTLNDSALQSLITAAQNKADQGVSDAASAAAAASKAQGEIDALEGTVGTLSNTVAGHTTTIGEHTTKITNLETYQTEHTALYNALKGTVDGHVTAIATKAEQTALDAVSAKAAANEAAIKTLNDTTIPGINGEIAKKANSADVYTKTEIGTIANGKTLVQMIADAQTAATYNDTQVKADIAANTAAIATLNGTAETTGSVLNIAKAEAEAAAKAEVAALIGEAPEALDTLEEIAAWISDDETGAAALVDRVSANEDAISAINNETTGILALAKGYTDTQIGAIPAATAEVLGLVKYDDDTIKMNTSKQLYVAKVSTDVLVQGTEELILNGGTALK